MSNFVYVYVLKSETKVVSSRIIATILEILIRELCTRTIHNKEHTILSPPEVSAKDLFRLWQQTHGLDNNNGDIGRDTVKRLQDSFFVVRGLLNSTEYRLDRSAASQENLTENFGYFIASYIHAYTYIQIYVHT